MDTPHPDTDAYQDLLDVIRPLQSALVAFSGGVDSTFVLQAALDALSPDTVLAVTLLTPYTPGHEVAAAKEAAIALGARHEELAVPFPETLRDNPPERCYLCKRLLFGLLVDRAAAEGFARVLDGTNADDLGDHRPGLQAVRELGIVSPVLSAGLGKEDVRRLSRQRGIAGWDRPAGACLLTRLPHGERVTEAALARIETGEDFLRGIGFPEARLRSHGAVARIEVTRDRIAALLTAEEERGIDAALKKLGYRHVAVDLAGYQRGSLNENAAPGGVKS